MYYISHNILKDIYLYILTNRLLKHKSTSHWWFVNFMFDKCQMWIVRSLVG